MITDSNGAVVSRRDFKPFGEELVDNFGGRLGENAAASSNFTYGANDGIRQKFTGYQKDTETGLDFAEARMYENRHGRFTAVDPLLASGKSANPQTFNRYVYVMNDPMANVDPSGLQTASSQDDSSEVIARIDTAVCDSWWCKLKNGFNQFFKTLVPNSPVERKNEEEEYAERKRGGVDKDVANGINNYVNGVNQLNNIVIENEPTGVGQLVKTTVDNTFGKASDLDVLKAWGSFAVTIASYVPVGRAYKIAAAGGKHSGLITNYMSRSAKEIEKAMRSLKSGKRGIDVHLDKIANPEKYVKNWKELTPEHQQRMISNWEGEIENFSEQIDVLLGILRERK